MFKKRNVKELFFVKKANFKFLRNEVTLALNRPKDGCNQIWFSMMKANPLHNMLISLFQNGKSFDFNIGHKPGNGLCTIDELEFHYK